MENKTSRYFKYAIGEIILVVIGILIALQINNWNERRKENKLEIQYLERLQNDLTNNKNELYGNIEFGTFQNEFSSILVKSLKDPITDSLTQRLWFIGINSLWFLPHPNFTKKTWNELNATGHIGLIKNKELVQTIADTYTAMDRHLNIEREWEKFHLDYRSKVNNLFEPNLRIELFKALTQIEDTKILENLPEIDPYLARFRQIENIEGILSDIQINRYAGTKTIEALTKNIEETLNLLDAELSKKYTIAN